MRNTLCVVAGTALLAGCLGDVGQPAPTRFAAFTLNSSGAPDGAPSVVPSAAFFQGNVGNIPNSRGADDRCSIGGFTATEEPASGGQPLPAGDAITMSLSGTQVTLAPVGVTAPGTYAVAGGARVPFTPGDVASFTIPGAEGGFPASQTQVRTVLPFAFDAVPVPSVGSDVTLRWTPPGDTSSAMTVSLRYAAPGAAALNEELFCALIDDGEHVIDAAELARWQQSAGPREVLALRLRTELRRADGALLYAVSSHSVRPVVAAP
jgi:hypothetical protein